MHWDFFNHQAWETLAVLAAAVAAFFLGKRQNQINQRLLKLQDFVAVTIVPQHDGKIKLLNTGRVNLYLCGFDLLGVSKRFDKPRLVAAGAGEAAYYWLPVPPLPAGVPFPYEFDIKLYLEDEFSERWISEHGGCARKEQGHGGGQGEAVVIEVWSYRTYKSDWHRK